MERLGTGLIRIKRELRANGSADPRIEPMSDRFTIALPRRELSAEPVLKEAEVSFNFIRAKRFPRYIYYAPTSISDFRDLKLQLLPKIRVATLHDGKLWSFDNLEGIHTVTGEVKRELLTIDYIENHRAICMYLIRRCVEQFLEQVVGLNNYAGRFIFPRPQVGEKLIRGYFTGKRRSKKTVVRPIRGRDYPYRLLFWEHHGLSFRPDIVSGELVLVLSPRIYFTSDGFVPLDTRIQHRQITRQTRRLFNIHYAMWLKYWLDELARNHDSIFVRTCREDDDSPQHLLFEKELQLIRLRES